MKNEWPRATIFYMLKLSTPIDQIARIQPIYKKKLSKLGIKTLKDLFYHIPSRYHDFSKTLSIGEVEVGEIVTIQGTVLDISNKRTWKKRIVLTEAIVEDESGAIKAVWFNQPFLAQNIKKGAKISLSGKVEFAYDNIFLSNPAYEIIRQRKDDDGEQNAFTHTAGLVAVYPETEGITSRYIRYIVKALIPKTEIKDFLPEEIKKSYDLPDLKKSIENVHFPKKKEDAEKARKRLAFEELFMLELFVIREKLKLQKENAPKIKINIAIIKKFVQTLPYKLTNAQRVTAWEILQDLERNRPMNRLLEGDVGSGKTVVATIAALNTVSQKWQTAFMAPTEILAEQHFKEISKLLTGFDITVGLLTGSSNKAIKLYSYKAIKPLGGRLSKKDLLTKIENGQIDIVVGTHALIQESVKFKNLALAIIDEQHRFGVEQRAKLTRSKILPHLLSMTATPIPRTLALTIYGDLDISLIDEMPRGRQKIITEVIAPPRRKEIYQFIRKEIKAECQAFVICPLIEESEKMEVKAATKEYEKLSQEIFPELKLELLHGKINPKEKERIMDDFKNKKADILVSTSVVEVGIDIPNATVMLIEGADRFGLSQLHQFRGRVGRGEHQSYCFLFTDSSSKKTGARLKAITSAKSGFELAERDLAIRGPGDFYGVRQSGLPDLTMSSLGDLSLIKDARKEALNILEKDSGLITYPLLQKKMKEFEKTIHLE